MKRGFWFKETVIFAVVAAVGFGCQCSGRRSNDALASAPASVTKAGRALPFVFPAPDFYSKIPASPVALPNETEADIDAWLEKRLRLDVERGWDTSVTEKWGALRKAARRLKPGLSQAEVEALLGTPVMRGETAWHFCPINPYILSRVLDLEVLLVTFDLKGNVQNWYWYSHFAAEKN